MGDKTWSPANVLDVFGDRIARATLVLASERPVTAKDVAHELEVSPATVYRRINPLVDAKLLKEHDCVGRNGVQHSEYETVLDEVTVAIEDSGLSVDITVRQGLGDDLEPAWSEVESSGARPELPGWMSTARADGRGDST